jgi:hypothetical protein
MGQELWKIDDHLKRMEDLAQGVLNHADAIKKIRAAHPHTFAFNYQVNAHHDRLWHVVYHCNGCGTLKTEQKEPVCSACDSTLKLCNKADSEAEAERIKPEHQGHQNPPLAFRCPTCRKVHILWHQGD